MLQRRHATATLLAVGSGLVPRGASAAGQGVVLRFGYPKVGLPVLARRRGTIEARLAAAGGSVGWIEFAAGPALLEAMNAGSIDFGYTGDIPPIFAQAAGVDFAYVGAVASSAGGDAILVPQGSPIATPADLRGKQVAFTKGSGAHNLVAVVLQRAGLGFADIRPAYLAPADALTAFSQGQVDAWAVWDHFTALAETKLSARTLVVGAEVNRVNSFFLASRTFADANPQTVTAALAGLGDAATWAAGHRGEVARALSEVSGVPIEVQRVVADRAAYGLAPLDETILARQQATADRFAQLGLIPKPVSVRERAWAAPGG